MSWCSSNIRTTIAVWTTALRGNPDETPFAVPTPKHLTDVDGTLFFTADDGVSGLELWKSDGTEQGTTLVKDIRPEAQGEPAPDNLGPRDLTNVGGTLYFSAAHLDGFVGPFIVDDRELWRSDGTLVGTTQVRDINFGPFPSYPRNLTNVDGTRFFTADDGESEDLTQLWKSDGTYFGTTKVKDVCASWLTNVGGTLFFSGAPLFEEDELWKSDGTEQGTTLVKDVWPGSPSSEPAWLTDVGGTLFFTARGPETPETNFEQLWKSDGTAAGTVRVEGVDLEQSRPELTNVGGTLFFHAVDDESGVELWKSDGTEQGTTLVKDIFPGPDGSSPGELTDVGGTLFFAATADLFETGRELWKTAENQPPTCAAVTASPSILKPTRDQWQLITLSGASDPDGDPISYHIDGVTQDEPVSGEGIGDETSPDAQLTEAAANSNELLVRAEANPKGNGRVYRIAYTVSDSLGASCSRTAGGRHRRDGIGSAPERRNRR